MCDVQIDGSHMTSMASFSQRIGSDADVLNPFLYRRLGALFGEVAVSQRGVGQVGHYQVTPDGLRYSMLTGGEYYRVNCPFCAQKQTFDTKQRLWIHHRWGVGLPPAEAGCGDMGAPDKFWWACICYNENCMADPDNVRALRDRVYGVGRDAHGSYGDIQPPRTVPVVGGPVDWPGRCVRIDQLAADHVACSYIRSRGFDVKRLGENYDVSYCIAANPEYPLAQGRLVIPVYMHGKMVNWQARVPYDCDWKKTHLRKYYNRRGTNKRTMLYGYDRAIAADAAFPVIVEGVTGVWAIGDGAVAILGKSLSTEQAELIAQQWKVGVLALDGDVDQALIDRALARLPAEFATVVVRLPAALDTGNVDQAYFWDLVATEAARTGVALPTTGEPENEV